MLRHLEGPRNHDTTYIASSSQLNCFVDYDYTGYADDQEKMFEFAVEAGVAVCS